MSNCKATQDGFQFATGEDHCIVFLFYGWNVDSLAKYVAMIIGVFCLGILNGSFPYIRHLINDYYRQKSFSKSQHIYLAVLYGVEIALGYWLILLVMTYESGIFISLIFGLIIGYFSFTYTRARKHPTDQTEMPTVH